MNRPWWATWGAALGIALTIAGLAIPGGGMSLALATDTETVASTITADTLDPPTDLLCNGAPSCTVALVEKPTLTWTATVDTYATGYLVWRSPTSGSGYSQVASVSGRTTTTWTDTTVSALTTYYYVVRSATATWTSGNSNEVQATVLL
jgi:hypothetical protein